MRKHNNGYPNSITSESLDYYCVNGFSSDVTRRQFVIAVDVEWVHGLIEY